MVYTPGHHEHTGADVTKVFVAGSRRLSPTNADVKDLPRIRLGVAAGTQLPRGADRERATRTPGFVLEGKLRS